jgi:catechol 2,3-dioxygenase-like lactoylglutathione lyase family enzyme
MLDHLSIKCSNMSQSAAFYDAILGTLGGKRIMDFGQAIGYGRDFKPEFWIGQMTTGEDFRESISPSAPRTGKRSVPSSRPRPLGGPKSFMSPGSGPNITPTTLVPSFEILMGTT